MKKVLTILIAIPTLTLFGGVGVLAYRIADTWSDTTTQSLMTGLTVVCGGGALLVAILLALIVGIPLAVRIFGETGLSQRAWGGSRTAGGLQDAPGWDDLPPRLPLRRTQWSPAPPPLDGQWRPSPSPTPPWGATHGGGPHLLPPPEQDGRFGLDER